LCHAGPDVPEGKGTREGAGASEKTGKRTRADNFSARPQSNAAGRAAERRATGARFEAHALAFLRRERLALVARNVHCRGGELDLVMRERDGTLVFVEVRARARPEFGGAAASVGWSKQQRVLRAARYFLATWRDDATVERQTPPACRFDVIAFESGRLVWLRDAFRADDARGY
jgi:putative endonuclease